MAIFTGLVLVIAVAIGSCSVPPSPVPLPDPSPAGEPTLPVTHWQRLFDDGASGLDRMSRPLSHSPDSWDFYNLAHALDGFTGMFEATGEERYADVALDYVEGMMATARPSRTLPTSQFSDDYLGWVSQQPAVRGEEVPLYESYCWRYVTRLLRLLRESPLIGDGAFRMRYDRVLAFTESHIFDKWVSRGADAFIYRERAHMAAHWGYIALDLATVTPDPDRASRYREVAGSIDDRLPNHPSSLRAQLRPAPGEPMAFVWSDVWGEVDPPQDVSHGNGVISYVVEARDVAGTWSADELRRFGRTLTAFVIGRNGSYPNNVDGTGDGNGFIADGFVKLGRYDRDIQALLEGYGVQSAQFYAAMAVNAKLLAADGAQ